MALAGFNNANVAAAQTAFSTAVADAFDQDPPGIFRAFTKVETGVAARYITQIEMGATPVMTQWEGTRPRSGFRALSKRYDMRKYQATLELDRTDVEWDTTGMVGKAIDRFLASQEYFADKLVMEEWLGNPTSVDGQALLSNSHPHGAANASWDNLTTDVLGFDTFNSAMAAFRTLQFENSEFRDVNPNLLIVGPDLERTAKEITGSTTRPVSIATAGTLDGAAGGAQVDNVLYTGGTVNVLVSPRFNNGTNDDNWVITDTRFPMMELHIARAVTAVSLTRPEDPERFDNDVYLFGLECDYRAIPGSIYGCYGRLG